MNLLRSRVWKQLLDELFHPSPAPSTDRHHLSKHLNLRDHHKHDKQGSRQNGESVPVKNRKHSRLLSVSPKQQDLLNEPEDFYDDLQSFRTAHKHLCVASPSTYLLPRPRQPSTQKSHRFPDEEAFESTPKPDHFYCTNALTQIPDTSLSQTTLKSTNKITPPQHWTTTSGPAKNQHTSIHSHQSSLLLLTTESVSHHLSNLIRHVRIYRIGGNHLGREIQLRLVIIYIRDGLQV